MSDACGLFSSMRCRIAAKQRTLEDTLWHVGRVRAAIALPLFAQAVQLVGGQEPGVEELTGEHELMEEDDDGQDEQEGDRVANEPMAQRIETM